MLRQHVFCPRIPYIREYRGIEPGTRLWLNQGLDYQGRQEMLNRRRLLLRYGLEEGSLTHNVQLRSEALAIHGICDAVIETSASLAPIEFKMSEDKPGRGQIMQLVAYALMLAESSSKVVDRGYILYGKRGRTLEVVIRQWGDDVLRVIREMKGNFERPLMPCSAASDHQCSQCEYLNFCSDRF